MGKVSHLLGAARVLLRLPMYGAFRAVDWPRPMPLAMSFVVTDRCNSRCKTCNIGSRYLADPSVARDELSVDEYARIFRTVGGPRWVTLSGGEPFMRADFAEILIALLRHARPWVVNVPTNGTLVEGTASALRRVLPHLGPSRLVLNFSVDGVAERHDEVRGMPGGFERVLRTIHAVRALRDPRLTIGVNTVISRFNVDQMEELLDLVRHRIRPDSQVLEAAQIRPEYHNAGEDIAADPRALARALDLVTRRLRRERRHGVARVTRAFRLEYYGRVRRTLRHDGGHRCFAGFASCTVMARGDVWSNSQRADPMGSLRDHGCDFAALWSSPEASAARARVRGAPCHCELSNASYCNALMDPSAMGRIAWNYLRRP